MLALNYVRGIYSPGYNAIVRIGNEQNVYGCVFFPFTFLTFISPNDDAQEKEVTIEIYNFFYCSLSPIEKK